MSQYSKEIDYKRPSLQQIYLTVRPVHQYMPKMHKIPTTNYKKLCAFCVTFIKIKKFKHHGYTIH